MTKRHHWRLWLLATAVWLGFLLAGLPDYYQQYSPQFMLVFVLLLLLPISGVLYAVLKRTPQRHRMRLALWIAFYFTVPLAVYDSVYCGVVLGRGMGFLFEYWYLTVYYIIPWLLAPAMASLADRREVARSEA